MKNQLKMGTILSYLQIGLGVIIGLLYTPMMIKLLGQSEYGLYNTVASTISMLSILNLGFNSSYIRYYAKYKADNNENAIWKLNGLFLLVFSFLGLVAFICGVFLTLHLDIVFSNGLTIEEYKIARILMLLLTVNLAVSFPMSVFSDIIAAHEKYVFLRLVGMIKTVFGPLVTLPLLLLGFRSIAMVLVTIGISFVSDILYFFYAVHIMHNRFIFHDFEKGLFKSLFSYTFFIAVNIVIDQINWNIDKIIIGRYKGTIEVAIYSVGYALSGYFMSFSTAISSVFTPKIHKIINEYSTDDRKQRIFLTDLFVRVGRIQFLVLGLIASGLVFFGKEFIEVYWAGNGYTASYYVALLLVLPLVIPLIQNLGIEIQRAQNKHQFRSIIYLMMAFINLFLSIYLCQLYGAIGSAIGTTISLVVANGVIMNIYYHKKCNINIVKFWKEITQMFIGLVFTSIFGYVIRKFWGYSGMIPFLVSIILYTVIYCGVMWIFSMNKEEKTMILALFRKICSYRRK